MDKGQELYINEVDTLLRHSVIHDSRVLRKKGKVTQKGKGMFDEFGDSVFCKCFTKENI